MTTTFLSTNNYRYRNALNLQNDVANTQNDWYFFVGQSIPAVNATLQPINEDQYTYINAWENMTFGKAIGANNVFLMINNNQWTTNTVYTMYDDKDPNLPLEPFFVVENEGSFWHVWKCLDNNQGANSTVQPTFTFVTATPYYQSSDGYRWKYMGSTDGSNVNNFATSFYFPVLANTTVAQLASNGSIDIIKVQSNGQFYNNYLDGTFQPGDIITSTVYNLSNNVVQKINGYYTGCVMYLTGGTGAGQFTQIIDYECNSSGNYIQAANNFVIPPDFTTIYQIRPSVQVIGSGTETVNCIARALINANAGNSVFRIEVLQNGRDYLDATASVIANVYVGVSNTANVRPILPPRGGHGAHIHEELYSNTMGMYVFLSNSESNTIPTSSIYQQIGLMRNPKFSNVYMTVTSTTGIFSNGETIYSVNTSQLNVNCTVNSTSNVVSCNQANFYNQLAVNSYVYITTSTGGAASLNQVAAITNSSQIQLSSNCLITDNNAIMYTTILTGNALCTSGGSSNIVVNACPGTWQTGISLIGIGSGATGFIGTVTRNGQNKSFNTFLQLYQYVGVQSGTFTIGETVSQGNTTAILYGITTANTLFYFSNFNNSNNIFTNGTVTGVSSGATATITNTYLPEVIEQTADIFYLQNINPVQRTNNQIETFQLLFSF